MEGTKRKGSNSSSERISKKQKVSPGVSQCGQDDNAASVGGILQENDKDTGLSTKASKASTKGKNDSKKTKAKPKKSRENRSSKNKKPGFGDECYNETSYYFENGLRKVYPYYFTFTTHAKGRWVGEKVLDVFAKEFRAHPTSEYERSIKAGALTVNNEKVDIDYCLKHNDLLSNVVHRHEVPVTADPITIIHMDDDIVVVNKPASIPVHPCGRYRHNTVVFILAKEYDLKSLRTIHRLDRLTSGLLLFGRTLQKASLIEQQIRDREVLKEYVCRVEGEFPDGEIVCEEPIEVVSYKIGVCKVSPNGKPCLTIFKKIGFNGKSSIVSCKPHTGRMHQIRVHLQYLGFPIMNDPLYNHPVFGPEKGKGGNIGKTDDQLIKELMAVHNAESWLGTEEDFCDSIGVSQKCDDVQNGDGQPKEVLSEVDLEGKNSENELDSTFNPEKVTVDEHCHECKVKFRDPSPSDLVMYLHALKYQGPGWSYQTELPDWASVDWAEEST
ncbi:RNA pseudouridylate synthase domain-containing protein 2 [Blattella germanica]|nr:RNA pseudouridylate synthase domain-containing protein 2 [Blattella germanica]